MFFKKTYPQVLCVGSACKDIFFPTAEAEIIETPEDITSKRKMAFELGGKYRVDDRFEAVGGVAANISTGLSRLGYTAGCYSNIGDDEMGRFILGELKKEGVLTDHISLDSGAKTDLSAIIVMTQNGERTIFHNRDANERLVLNAEYLKETQWLFVSALNGTWQDHLTLLVAIKKANGLSLAFNPGQHNIKEDAATILSAVKESDVLLLNKDEAIEIVLKIAPATSHEILDDETFLLKKLFAEGAKAIGMTDGMRGSWGYDGKECWHCKVHTRHGVLDSTGAGDAFGSGFLATFMRDGVLSTALAAGMANSGSVVGSYGASAGLLTPKELQSLVPDIKPVRLA